MDTSSKRYALSLLLLTLFIYVDAFSNDSLKENPSGELRKPRVSGRIVKVYSGTRPEPVLCTTEGFQSDPVNCAVFYRCVKERSGRFSVFRYQCAPGTVYDPDLETCNFPRHTKRSECGGIMKPISSPINTEYINEVEGVRKEILRPFSTLAPKFTKKEMKPSTLSSQKYEKPITSTIDYDADKYNNFISVFTTTHPWTSTIVHKNEIKKIRYENPTTQSPYQTQSGIDKRDICLDDGFIGDFDNCRKFYRCVGNQRGGYMKYEFYCSESTVWDDDLQSCNHPWAVKRSKCGRSLNYNQFETDTELLTAASSMKENGYGYKTIQQQLQISHGSKVSQTQTQISHSNNVIQNQTQINYDDNNNNTKQSSAQQNQTQISHGSAVSQTQTQIDYGNKGMQTQLQIDHSKNSSQSQTQIHESTTKQTTTSQHSQQGTTNNQCSENGFIGDSSNCKKFYRCVDNGRGSFTKYEYLCGEGTVWDSKIESCNHAWAVKECGGHTFTESNKEEITTTTTKSTSGGTTKTTQSYHTITTESSDDDNDVGYGNQGSSGDITSSTYTTTSTTEKTYSEGSECTSSGFIGDSKDCKKFYRCVDNGNGGFTKHEFTCGEGTVWDPKIDACNHAWAVESCGGSNNNQQETQPSTNEPTPASQATVTDKNTNYPSSEPTSTSSFPTTSTTGSVMGNDCTNGGFMGDYRDCKKFYRCVDNGDRTYTRYEFTCGEGTVWDSRIDACNHAWAVEKCGGSKEPSSSSEFTTSQHPILHEEYYDMTTQSSESIGTTSSATTSTQNEIALGSNECDMSGYFGDKNDCKKFYRCVDDGNDGYYRYEYQCGEGTVWDDSIRACNHAWAVKECGSSNMQQSPTQSSTDRPQEGNQEPIEESTSEVSSNTYATQKPQTTQGVCKSEGFYGDPSDCKKFYRCVDDGKSGYTKYDFMCGDGTTWNQEIKACDHESDDNSCLSSSTSSGLTTTAPQYTETLSSTTIEKETQESTHTESSTTEKCTSEGFFAHSQDCKKFIRCVSSGNDQYTKYEFSCGEGTVWVQEIQACDHDNGHCELQSLSTSTPQNSENPNTTSSSVQNQTPIKENDEYETPNESSQNDESDDECTSEGYYGNSKDCTKFYRCVDNGSGGYTKYDFVCGEGTAWDSNLQTCNHISEVESCSRNNNDETQTQQTQTPKDEQSQTTESSTSTTKQTSSTTESASKDTCEKEGYFGDSQDCTKFYRCVDNGKGGLTKYDFVCGEGTIWDKDITNCNHPQDVSNPSCSSNQGESSSSSGSETTTSSSQSSSSTTENESSSNCSQDNSTEKPGEGNKNVTCDKAGYYPNPNDCKKFYRCVDWDGDGKRFSVYHFDCGEGTIWDPALDTCNHEESVYPPRDCSGSQSQSQSETTTDQSTTSEQTTTEESTTTEQIKTTTTEQQTTSEQTTTQQSTTSEQTTTQQSTTSEQTTTQQSITSEQTTQEQTTSEQTTTQQSTSSEQTTTQESTTSEQTTQQTSEQTTQESTTSEQSTTQESTTSEQTTEGGETTESPTTTEQSESTTDQSSTDSTSTEEQESTTETSSSSNGDCPETEDDQYVLVCPTSFKRHPKYCNMFYQCTEDEDTHDVNVAMFKCPNETIYDENQTQCVEEKKADNKCEGQMARKQRFKKLSNREPIVVDKEKKSCPSVGYYAFEKSECSPAFLRCEKHKSGQLRGFVNQCPKGYIFWSISKRCERTITVIDCKRSTNDWTQRWNIPIDRKNIAF